MLTDIWIFKVNVVNSIKILKFDGNLRSYRILLEYERIPNQSYEISWWAFLLQHILNEIWFTYPFIEFYQYSFKKMLITKFGYIVS